MPTRRVGAPCWALQRQLSAAEAASMNESKEKNQNCTEGLWVQDVGFQIFHPSPDWEQGAHGIKCLIHISSGFFDSELWALCLSLICTHSAGVLWACSVHSSGDSIFPCRSPFCSWACTNTLRLWVGVLHCCQDYREPAFSSFLRQTFPAHWPPGDWNVTIFSRANPDVCTEFQLDDHQSFWSQAEL